jgi:SPP1 gp7 family putative phage head morphogenesis protein
VPSKLEERAERRKARQLAKERWANAHKGWKSYSRNLEAAARMVGQIIKAHLPTLESGEAGWQLALQQMIAALERYSKALDPWAISVARLMLAEVDRREKRAWIEHGREIGRNLLLELENAPTGRAYQEGMQRQVGLITSLPLVAAQRVHELAIGQLYSGLRGKELLEEILKTGNVTVSRAKLIARTEVARASTELTRARAEYVGSPGYIWRTARDVDVRASHKKLEGTFHRWDDPPLCDYPNYHAHPGQIFNCRCYPEVIVPDVNDIDIPNFPKKNKRFTSA